MNIGCDLRLNAKGKKKKPGEHCIPFAAVPRSSEMRASSLTSCCPRAVMLKWKLKNSGKSVVSADGVLLGPTQEGAFSWSRHRRRDVMLKQMCEGTFLWSRHRRKGVLLEQTCERTRDEGFFTNYMHVLIQLTCAVEFLLSGVHREKFAKKTSGGVLQILATSIDSGWSAEWLQLRQFHMVRQDACWGMICGGHMMFWRSLNRTRRTVMKAEVDMLVELDVQSLWVSSLHRYSLPW